ncbi:hypothetical protein [Actinoplanes sp. TFC3]|uniref:hypothetical protein n=1 Tax=Actinoplanes sp. TFC3 TaxID=1710355 RepID=UPI0012902730|nr:hypothetical protein [Actinoplanes sp. TFC3]
MRSDLTGFGGKAAIVVEVRAFTMLGGVRTGKIRCDNLKAAGAQVLGFTRQRGGSGVLGCNPSDLLVFEDLPALRAVIALVAVHALLLIRFAP